MKHRLSAVFLTVLFMMILTVPVYANAEAGPDFTVLITGAPEDLEITLETPDGVSVELQRTRRGWESCWRFYYSRLYDAMYPDARYNPDKMKTTEETAARSVLRIVSVSEDFDCTVPMPESNQILYNHLAVLEPDYDAGTATLGSSSYMVWRNVLLVVLRISVTLLAEGVIFHLMSYRTRRSWLIFLIVNLVTQLGLNLTITGNYLAMGYWEIGFFFMEALIFLTEAVVFAIALTEHHRLRGFVTAILANALSLLCGWALLANMPL